MSDGRVPPSEAPTYQFGDADEDEEVTKVGPAPRRAVNLRDRACLVVVSGPDVGQMHRVVGADVIIGRSVDANVRLTDDDVSRRHARIVEEGGRHRLEDLGSANGTQVNGVRIGEPVFLSDGDKVELGSSSVLKFAYHDELDEQFQRNMFEAAQRDGLTKAFNKRYFLERLTAELAFARRHDTALCLVMVDADHFKAVNDTYGHVAGDEVLVRLAALVQSTIRTEDVFARYGGEEFAVICRGILAEGAWVMADRLRRRIATSDFTYGGQRILLTVSIGFACFPEAGATTTDELIFAADSALYTAKRAGRNRCVAYAKASSPP